MARLDSYKFELTCGLLTGLFGTVNFLFGWLTDSFVKPTNNTKEFVTAFLIWLGLPMLVAAGSYLHSIKRSILGILMITVGAIFSILMICMVLISILISPHSSLILIMFLTQNIMAVITLVVLIVEEFNRTNPHSSSTLGNLST